MKFGISCYPTEGGSGVVATELGKAMAFDLNLLIGRSHYVYGFNDAELRRSFEPEVVEAVSANLSILKSPAAAFGLREFGIGGAELAGRGKMIAALQRLQAVYEPHDLPDQFAAFGINGAIGDGLKRLFMSHPPLAERISALQRAPSDQPEQR